MSLPSVMIEAELGRDDTNDSVLVAVLNAFDANRASFSYGTIKYQHVIGQASSEGDFSFQDKKKTSIANCEFLFVGSNCRFERVYQQNEEHRQVRNLRVVTNGQGSLLDSNAPPYISPGRDTFDECAIVPLSLGFSKSRDSISKIGEMVLEKKAGCRLTSILENQIVDGTSTIKLTIESDVFANEYWVDLARGAIPIMTRSTNKKDKIFRIERYQDIKAIPSKGWLPMKWSYFLSQGLAQTISIIHYDFEKIPEESSFTLKFPKPVRMPDMSKRVTYPPQISWNLSNLPNVDSPLNTKMTNSTIEKISPPNHPGEREPFPWTKMFLIFFGIFLIFLATIRMILTYRSTKE
jgi:hypothetical protein